MGVKQHKKILGVLSLTLMLNFTTVFAKENVKDLKNKKTNAESKMTDKKKEIKTLESETKKVEDEIKKLQNQIDKTKSELKKAESEIHTLTNNIKKTEEELAKKEDELEESEETFSSRLRVMYKNGNLGYLELLLSSADLKDFISRTQMLQKIADHDVKLIENIKDQKEEIERHRVNLKSQRASLEATKTRLDSKKDELQTASRSQEQLRSKLKADISKAEKEYDALNKLAKDIEKEILAKQNVSKPYSGGAVGGGMGWPVPGYTRISSPFGYRVHPVFKTKKFHSGVDIPAPSGVTVNAAAGGKVIHAGRLGGYGNTVMIDHGGGVVSLYGHNSSLLVSNGATVSRGTPIARIGSTGVSTGPHLHFEVRKNGGCINPLSWLK